MFYLNDCLQFYGMTIVPKTISVLLLCAKLHSLENVHSYSFSKMC